MTDTMTDDGKIDTKWYSSDSIANLIKARIAAAADIRHAEKNAVNPHLRNKYADLGAVLDAIQAIHKHGLTLFHLPSGNVDNVEVTAMLAHESGEFLACTIGIKPDKPTAQAMGSAITYARRYTASALLGISQADDDGNEASGRGAPAIAKDAPKPAPNREPGEEEPDLTDDLIAKLDACTTADAVSALRPELGRIKNSGLLSDSAMKLVVRAYRRAIERVAPPEAEVA